MNCQRLFRSATLLGLAATLSTAGTAAGQPAGLGLPERYQFMVGQDQPGFAGSMRGPLDVGPDQSIYVLAGDRVLRFGRDGGLANAWGRTGDQPGSFRGPTGIAVAPDGTVYVADGGNHRVQRFTAWGTFMGQWGQEGREKWNFASMAGLTVSHDGTVYVADNGLGQIKRFGPTGTFMSAFRASDPRDVAVSAEDRIYVAEYGASRVAVYDVEGRRLGQRTIAYCVGRSGLVGIIEYACAPSWVTLSPDGSIYADAYGAIDHFSPTFETLPLGAQSPSGARGLAVTHDLGLIALDSDGLTVYSAAGLPVGTLSDPASTGPGFSVPVDVDAAADGRTYVVDRAAHSLSILGPDGFAQQTVGGDGWGNGLLHEPAAVLVLPDSSVLVADSGNNRLQRFSPEGRWQAVVLGRETLDKPMGLALAPNGMIAVADGGHGRIVFTDQGGKSVSATPAGELPGIVDLAPLPDGRFLAVLAPIGKGKIVVVQQGLPPRPWGDGTMIGYPAGIAVRGTDVYVTDHSAPSPGHGNHDMEPMLNRFDLEGRFRNTVATGDCAAASVEGPEGVAAAPDGRILVADTLLRRVLRLGPTAGRVEGLSGMLAAGSGRLDRPAAVAAGPGGRVFVADAAGSGNRVWVDDAADHRIQALGLHGELLGSWRPSGCSGKQAGVSHFSGAQLGEVSDAALAADGSLFVADSANHRVSRFDPAGQLLDAWGAKPGDHPLLDGIRDLAAIPEGGFVITQAGSARVARFAADGSFATAWGSVGSGPGQFAAAPVCRPQNGSIYAGPDMTGPADVAVDPDGSLLVADPGNHRLQRFTVDGRFLSAFEPRGSASSGVINPHHIAVGTDGTVYVADYERIAAFGPDGSFLREVAGPGHEVAGRCPTALAVTRSNTLYAVFALESIVEVMNVDGHRLGTWRSGRKDTPKFAPFDINEAADGTLLVTDRTERDPTFNALNAVLRFSPAGEMLGTWVPKDSLGDPEGRASNGSELRIAPIDDGSIFMASSAQNWVSHMGPGADFRRKWRSILHGPGRFESPMGVAIAREPGGREVVYVSERGEDAIDAFDLEGNFIRRLGGSTQSPARFRSPGGLGVTPEGRLLVTEPDLGRVQVLGPDGTTLLIIGQPGDGPGQLNHPRDVAARQDGLIVVADTGNQRLAAFDPDGAFLGQWNQTSSVTAPLQEPVGLAFADQTLWVADSAARRVVAFADTWPRNWHLRAYRDRGLLDGPTFVTAPVKADLDWGLDAPAAALPPDGFSLRLERPVPETGRYSVRASVTGRATLDLGAGTFVGLSTGHPARLDLPLEAGRLVRVDYMDPGGPAALKVDVWKVESSIWLPWMEGR